MKRLARVEIFGGRYSVSNLQNTGTYFHSNNTENPKTILFVNDKKKKKRPTFGTIQQCQCLLSEKDVFKISLFVQDKTDTNLFILHSFFKPYHLITYLKFNIRSSTCVSSLLECQWGWGEGSESCCNPYLRPERRKTPCLFGGTYRYGLYRGVLPLPPKLPFFVVPFCVKQIVLQPYALLSVDKTGQDNLFIWGLIPSVVLTAFQKNIV